MKYFSQDGQDKFIADLFKNKRKGIFVDIGAYDGITFSNSFYLEKQLAWKGICIEPNPIVYEQLTNNRNSVCINCCIGSSKKKSEFLAVSGAASMLSGLIETFDPNHLARIDEIIRNSGGSKKIYEVPVIPLKDILKEKASLEIDYCNIDVEGGEQDVLSSIDFSKVKIKIFTIENNYDSSASRKFLKRFGYSLIAKLGADEVFELKSKRYGLIIKLKIKKIKNALSIIKHRIIKK